MSRLNTLLPVAAALAVSVAGAAHATENPFALKAVTGVVVADAGKEGKCGEGKCGSKPKEASSDAGQTKSDAGQKGADGKAGGTTAKDAAGKSGQ